MLKVVVKCNFSIFCQNALDCEIVYLKIPNLQSMFVLAQHMCWKCFVSFVFKGKKVCCNESCKKCPALYRDSLGWNKVAQMCKYHYCNTVFNNNNNSNNELKKPRELVLDSSFFFTYSPLNIWLVMCYHVFWSSRILFMWKSN